METVVECTNCGSGEFGAQFWVTVGALGVAFAALLMNAIQFREYLRRLSARARFSVDLSSTTADADGIHRTEAQRCATRVSLGIKNNGERAAGETLINVLIPAEVDMVRWCGPHGEELGNGEQDVVFPTAETLTTSDGATYDSQYVVMTLPRIGTKPHHVLYLQFYVDLPARMLRFIPVRATVQADEIPDDVDEYVAELEVQVLRE